MSIKQHPLFIPFYNEDIFDKNDTVITYFHRQKNYGNFYLHSHKFLELNAIIKGRGVHFIGDKSFEIEPGDIFVIPPFIKHNYVFNDSGFNVFHIIFKNEFFLKYNSVLKSISGYNMFFDIEPYLRIHNKNTRTVMSFSDKFGEYVKDFERLDSFDRTNSSPENVELFALFIISSICRGIVEKSENRENNLDPLFYIIKSIDFLQKNFAQKLSIDTLASEANMSKSTFLRYFKTYYDTTPLDYLNRYRVQESKRLLVETKLNVTTIAQECGFFDSSHFIRLFKKIENVTPAQFRAENRPIQKEMTPGRFKKTTDN